MNILSLQEFYSKHCAQYFALTKPRITQLTVFCAAIGMFLAMPTSTIVPPLQILFGGSIGIWLLTGAAFAINCLLEKHIDMRMLRTLYRPSVCGTLTQKQIIIFSFTLTCLGILILYLFTNVLTILLTLLTFIGYTIIYTIFLKPTTPQNIVIGGITGAMPPALGWSAVTGNVSANAWILVLIIFVWTPPHFWTLALYRKHDYINAKLPMLPITHGEKITRLHILLYSILLIAVSLLPFISCMSGLVYLIFTMILDIIFFVYAWKIWTDYSENLAKGMFRYSIIYLFLLFFLLLIDHHY